MNKIFTIFLKNGVNLNRQNKILFPFFVLSEHGGGKTSLETWQFYHLYSHSHLHLHLHLH